MRARRVGALVAAHPSFHARHLHHRGREHRAAARSHSVHAQLGGEWCTFFPVHTVRDVIDRSFGIVVLYLCAKLIPTRVVVLCVHSSNNPSSTVNTISRMISPGTYTYVDFHAGRVSIVTTTNVLAFHRMITMGSYFIRRRKRFSRASTDPRTRITIPLCAPY